MAAISSAPAPAPRIAPPTWELRRLMFCALALYAVGVLAKLTDHAVLAGMV